jgi:hypothetical protein
MKNIAVIFRGHVRTFHLIHEYVLQTYDRLAENVDYYFVTWQVPNLDTPSIELRFEGKNLIKLLTVPIVDTLYNSWLGSSWLSYNILPYKRLREKQVKYDAVIDTRPDVAALLPKNYAFYLSDENIIVPNIELHFNHHKKYKDVAVNDWFFIMKSHVYDVMSQRYIMDDTAGTQISYRLFAEQENFHFRVDNSIQTMISRPNIAPHKLSDDNFLFLQHTSRLWPNLTKEEKLEFVKNYGVNVEDYETNCIHAKI